MNPNSMPRVCVLMATHNGLPWIGDQLNSILNQVKVDVEVLVSDDGSSDGTREWLARRSREDARVQVLRHDLHFGSAAGNFYFLINNAPTDRYRLFALADQDDIWDLDKLSKHVQQLESRCVAAVSSDVVAFWSSGRTKLLGKAGPQRRWDYLFEPPGPGCTFLMTSGLVARCQDVLRDFGRRGLAPMPFHDWMIYLVARASQMSWWIDPAPSVQYRQHGRNEVGAHVGWAAIRSRLLRLAQGRYKGLVSRAMMLAMVACSEAPTPTRLGVVDILCQGRRRWREALVAALFMPFGVKAAVPGLNAPARHPLPSNAPARPTEESSRD